MTQPFLIANMEVGLQRDREPWLLPDEAFPVLEDAYLFRGRIKRRAGYANLGRLCEQATQQVLGVRGAAPDNYTGPLTLPGGSVQIQPGSVSITDGVTIFVDDGAGTMVVSVGSGTGGAINYFTGVINVTFDGAIPPGPPNVTADYCIFYGRPVMGLRTREITVINQEQLIGFDTEKANVYSNTNQLFQDITTHKTTGNAFSWTGTNSDFFWTTNYANAFWATNSINGFQNVVDTTNPASGDGIRWYDGAGWINFLPQVDSTNFLMGATIIVSYRNRLLMLNTTEGTAFGASTNFQQRARWSQNGTPYYVTPVPAGFTGGVDASSWRSDQGGKGGFIDAPTSEQIISAQFIHDTLIVYFERSTWQLRYTGDPVLPFIWERINVELGAESTFSIVPFDRGLLGVGNYGIIAANNSEVKRIDQKIPDEVFNIHNGNDGVKRVYGIRDYAKQLVYWTFPDDETDPTFPTRVLIYDYLEGTYAIFNESITCFGVYQPINDTTWADLNRSWVSYPFSWENAQLQSDYPLIVAGNQQGFVFKNYNSGPIINDPSLYITGATQAAICVITSPNHNLKDGSIIAISNVVGMTELNGNIYRVLNPQTNTFEIQELDANDNFIDVDSTGFSAYVENGLIQVRNNIKIQTKKFNPFINTGYQVRLRSIDFFLEFSSGLEFTTRVYLDENNNEFVEAIIILPETNILNKVWYPAYYSSIGQFNQIEITFSPKQMFTVAESDGDITLHAFMMYMERAGRLTYGEIV
jgi:hypothetical protein